MISSILTGWHLHNQFHFIFAFDVYVFIKWTNLHVIDTRDICAGTSMRFVSPSLHKRLRLLYSIYGFS